MFSTELLSSVSSKITETTAGFSLILPELVVGIWILVSIFADLFLHGKPAKTADSWRYFLAQMGILLALGLAFQRMTQGLAGFVSFQLFQVNIGSNTINVLIIALGALLLGLNQLHQKSFSLEENIGFSAILLGSLLTSMSAHFLTVFLSLELISMGTYILVAMRKDAIGARAALPYVLFGLGSSAIFLYGMSLLYGLSGNMYLFSADFSRGIATADPVFAYLALGLVGTGILFKMAWVPFHPWSPDLLESLPASWMSWISVAPKLAVSLLGIKLVHYVPISMVSTISLLAMATLLVGNLAAMGQKNSKRLLAYSSIANNGLMSSDGKELVSKDVNEIAKKLLGQTATVKDLQDPEAIIDYVIKLPNYEELVADARETLGREGVKLPEAGKVESFVPGTGAWFRKMIEVIK